MLGTYGRGRRSRERSSVVAPRILVADDAAAFVEFLRDLLLDEGYAVLTLPALPPDPPAIRRSKPDLLILDYLIGEQSVGWNVVRQLRAARSTARLPIILCTAATLPPERLVELQRLDVAVLFKPLEIDDLLACIETLLGRSRAQGRSGATIP